MKWQDLIIDGFSRVLEICEPAMKGLKKAELEQQPKPDCNSIGWIAWHLTRGMDAQIAELAGKEQVWTDEKWFLKFKRPQASEDTGYGHSTADVTAFKSPSAKVLLDYYKSAMTRTEKYLRGLSLQDLDKTLDEAWNNPRPTVGVRIISIMADCLEHAGEISYVRGLITGKGWSD